MLLGTVWVNSTSTILVRSFVQLSMDQILRHSQRHLRKMEKINQLLRKLGLPLLNPYFEGGVLFMETRNNSLQIKTLGRFEVKRGDQMISPIDQRLSKRWRLFQLLISYKGQTLPTENIYQYLDLEESVNPGEALKSLVFHLRKSLNGKKSEHINEDYVICSGGTYRFNEDSDYWLDAEEFENLYKKTRSVADESIEEAISIFQKAMALYKGNYLAEVPNSYWASSKKKRYRELFLEGLLEANNLMRQAGMYKEAWELCEQGLRIVPLEEKLHVLSLQSLIDSNKISLALIQYQEAAQLFKGNNLDVPSELRKLGESLKSKLGAGLPTGDFLNRLKDYGKGNGAIVSEMDTFSVIYQLEKNRNERRNKPGFLISLDLKGNLPPEIGEQVHQKFQNILKSSLRKGDVICKGAEKNYLALIINATQPEIEGIIGRLRKKIPADWEEMQFSIESRAQKL